MEPERVNEIIIPSSKIRIKKRKRTKKKYTENDITIDEEIKSKGNYLESVKKITSILNKTDEVYKPISSTKKHFREDSENKGVSLDRIRYSIKRHVENKSNNASVRSSNSENNGNFSTLSI